MKTLQEFCDKVGSSAYFGKRGDWLLAWSVHRDSDSLSRSNWQVLLARLGGESETVQIERFNHWAVGWIDHLLIDPADIKSIAVVERAQDDMESYPVLDESHWSELEWDEFWQFAESELKQFDNWETVLDEVMQSSPYGVGDGEWELIQEARERLESVEA